MFQRALAICCCLGLVSELVAAPATGAARLGKGFSYHHEELPEGPWSVHLVKVARSSPNLELHTTLGNGARFGISPLSQQIKAIPAAWGKPVAGINGDYYRDEGAYTGDPKGLQIMRGELISAPSKWTCFWVDTQGNPQMAIVTSQLEVIWPGGQTTPIGLNEERPRNGAVLYTPAVGPSTRSKNGRDIVLEQDGDKPWLPLHPGKKYSARVSQIQDEGNATISSNTMVLSTGSQLAIPELKPGNLLGISTATSPSLEGVTTAIGGGPALVRDGKALPRDEIKVRNPCTALGWNDQFIFLVEIDGRQRNLSVGMTMVELSNYMAKIGCQFAMSLDGGGSSTCWVYGQVMNSPSEGFERAMANALVLVQKDPKK